jgi:hypothetical protein
MPEKYEMCEAGMEEQITPSRAGFFKMSLVHWAEQLSQNKMGGLLLHPLRVLLDSTAGINTMST